jgi:hypothetical protein
MQTVKQIVHDIADHLPDQASFDDAMDAVYVRQKLQRSLNAAEEGKVTSQEEMEKRSLPMRVEWSDCAQAAWSDPCRLSQNGHSMLRLRSRCP